VTGIGAFVDPFHMEVQGDNGKKVVKFKQAIIAAGSQAVKLPFMPEDPRVVDSTGALELRQLPKRMLVIGGGIIGLEMATVYSTLGAEIDVVEMMDGLMHGRRPRSREGLGKVQREALRQRDAEDQDGGREAKEDGIYVKFEGEKAPAEAQRYDLVLVAVGRSPNGKKIGADKAGVAVTERGFIDVDKQMRTNVPHIFAIGDIVGSRCSRTRPCMKATSQPKPRTAKRRTSTRCRFRRWPTPIRKWHGPARRKISARPKASSTARRCSRGPRRAARSRTAATKASPS
jgi:dihydrolipoamide dehydrogenase